MGLILKANIQQILSEEYAKCQKAVFVTAYLTDGIFRILGDSVAISSKQVKLFARGNKADFLNGSVSVETLLKLLNANMQCYLLQNLHAKLYVFDDRSMFIGSANLTNNGLSSALNSNIEVLYDSAFSDDMKMQLQEMLRGAVLVTEDLLDKLTEELEQTPPTETLNESVDWSCISFSQPSYLNMLTIGDLPLCHLEYIDDFVDTEEFIHDQYLFGIEKDGSINLDLLEQSVLHNFLIELIKNEPEGFIRFGSLEKVIANQCDLHDENEIESLVQNIYSYYKANNSTVIQYLRPNHTEVLSLR